jgi:ribonuclease E
MSHPEEHGFWDDIAEDLGLPPAAAPAKPKLDEESPDRGRPAPQRPTHQEPRTETPELEVSSPEPSEDRGEAEEGPPRGRRRRRRGRGSRESEAEPRHGDAEATDEGAEPGPVAESPAADAASLEDDAEGPSGAPSHRRRRRRRRKSANGRAAERVGTAPVEELPAPAGESEEQAGDTDEVAEIEPATEGDDDVEIEDLTNLNVPSWAEIVASLYRPER